MIHGIINRFQPTSIEKEAAEALQKEITGKNIKEQVDIVKDKAFTGFKGKLKFIGRNIGQNFHKLARTVRTYQKKDIKGINDESKTLTKKEFKHAYAQLFDKDINIEKAKELVDKLINSADTHNDLLQVNTPGLRKQLVKLMEDLKPTNTTDDIAKPEDKDKSNEFQAFKNSALELINKKNTAQGLKVEIDKKHLIQKPSEGKDLKTRARENWGGQRYF